MDRIVFHIDDVGATHGSNTAMDSLEGTGLVTCGSVIVPSAWFPETLALADRKPHLDLGVHLTLTSESAAFRWRPLTTTARSSGLIDGDGFFWPDVPSLRRHAQPDAVQNELRAQIQRAISGGLTPTHLDHHMGAALVPEFAEITVGLAIEFELPVLFPTEFEHYIASVELGDEAGDLPNPEPDVYVELRRSLHLHGLAIADRFVIGLRHLDRPAREVYRSLLATPTVGTTFVSLHANAPGDVAVVHPSDATFRVEEFELLADPEFVEWVLDRGWHPIGLRDWRAL